MRKILNIGEIPNDGKGDKLRHAFDLSQQNFVEIYKFFGDGQNITSLSVRQKLDTPTNAEVDTKIKTATTLSRTHMGNVSNPHNVTKEQVGLNNVDNTSDANKPVSIATQQALNLKANLNTTQQALNLKANLDATKKVPIAELYEASTTQKGITQLVNDLTTGGIDKAPTAEVIKLFFSMFQSGGQNRFRVPNFEQPNKPWLIQFSSVNSADYQNTVATFPVAFPNECKCVIGEGLNMAGGMNASATLNSFSKTIATFNCFIGAVNQMQRLAEKDGVVVYYIAIGN